MATENAFQFADQVGTIDPDEDNAKLEVAPPIDPTNIFDIFPSLRAENKNQPRIYSSKNLSNTKKGPGRVHFQGNIQRELKRRLFVQVARQKLSQIKERAEEVEESGV